MMLSNIGQLFAQDNVQISKLLLSLENTPTDSARIVVWNQLARQYQNSDLDSVWFYAGKALQLARATNNGPGQADAYFGIGNGNYIKGNYPETLKNYNKALAILDSIGDKKGVANAMMGIGNVLAIQEEYNSAIDYQLQSIDIRKEIKDSLGIAGCYNNLGSIYTDLKDYPKALEYLHKSMAIKERNGLWKALSSGYGNIGGIYQAQGKLELALDYQKKALELRKKLSNKKGMVMSYTDLGDIYFRKKDYFNAVRNLLEALHIADEVGFTEGKLNTLLKMSEVYEEMGKYERALSTFREYTVLKDSVFSLDKASEILRIQTKYESKQKDGRIVALKEKEKLLEENAQQDQYIEIILTLFFVASLLLSFFLYKLNVQRLKANNALKEEKLRTDEQAALVLEKNQHIMASIDYARKIQRAILPKEEVLKSCFTDHFILYQPKEIVSGDFYWLHAPDENRIILAVVDCTGHGVPGALMSLVGNSGLNWIVKERNICTPSKILDELNRYVKENLNKDQESRVVDGMDLSICLIDLDQMKMEYAGAYNPVYLYRNNEMEVLDTDKYQIGVTGNAFHNGIIDLQPNDQIYLFTDGYADQFGGEKGKKIGYSSFRDILSESAHETMNEQRLNLLNAFVDWKQNDEQVDDVCVIGVRL